MNKFETPRRYITDSYTIPKSRNFTSYTRSGFISSEELIYKLVCKKFRDLINQRWRSRSKGFNAPSHVKLADSNARTNASRINLAIMRRRRRKAQ
jgi:hypothetical protein